MTGLLLAPHKVSILTTVLQYFSDPTKSVMGSLRIGGPSSSGCFDILQCALGVNHLAITQNKGRAISAGVSGGPQDKLSV